MGATAGLTITGMQRRGDNALGLRTWAGIAAYGAALAGWRVRP